MFGEIESRSYEPVHDSDSRGMRSDAIVKHKKKKYESEESACIEKKSKLIKSDDTEIQHVPVCSKDSLSERSSNDRPKFSRFPSMSNE